MASTMGRRIMNTDITSSQQYRSLAEEKYKETRKSRRVLIFCNGDRFFKGKKLNLTPHRYLSYNDLLNDLTYRMPANLHLPNGVRQLFTPVGGRRINDISDIKDGESYVCSGNESFKPIRYGANQLAPWGKYTGMRTVYSSRAIASIT